MKEAGFRGVCQIGRRLVVRVLLAGVVWAGLMWTPSRGQSQATEDLGGCTLKDHVYHCDGAVFQKALAAATTVRIETHNADGVARSQLGDLVSKKLGKTIVAPSAPADLSFLMMPVDDQGVINDSPGGANLGTLRIYTVTPDGSRGHLLWAETFSGDTYMPWPAVVHGLILQFQERFKIK
jgi:hypothetical protein